MQNSYNYHEGDYLQKIKLTESDKTKLLTYISQSIITRDSITKIKQSQNSITGDNLS